MATGKIVQTNNNDATPLKNVFLVRVQHMPPQMAARTPREAAFGGIVVPNRELSLPKSSFTRLAPDSLPEISVFPSRQRVKPRPLGRSGRSIERPTNF